MATPKQRLRKSIEDLTEEQAGRALEWVQQLLETGQREGIAGITAPPADAPLFAEFEPLVVSGSPASTLLIADRR